VNASIAPKVCSICERADCRLGSHSGPDRRWLSADELDRERAERITRARASDVALGPERAVVENLQARLKRLPVTDITAELRARALMALDELFDAYGVEREVESRRTVEIPKDALHLVADLGASLAAAGKVSA